MVGADGRQATDSAIEFASLLRPGDRILVGQGTGEPRTLTEALVAQRRLIGPVEVFLGVTFTETFQPEHADTIRFRALGGFGVNGRLFRAGVLDIVPCHTSSIPALIAEGKIGADVVLLQVSPADSSGQYSLGLVADYLRPAIDRARVVIAEVNERVPRTRGETLVDASDIDCKVHTERSLIELPPAAIGEVERTIGQYVAERIGDGAVLQFGIGAIPEAICVELHDRRDLGIHSGMITDRALDLIESGAVTNRLKAIDKGTTITGVLFGTERLYNFAHENPGIQLRPVSYTHNASVLGRLDRFVSINSALEVDLTGQVNAEVLGGVHMGAVGGAVDFVRAAAESPGGRSIVALPSSAGGGTISRIVPRLDSGVVSTPRSDVDLLVTEFGVAELRGQGLRARARQLIRIAHPRFRAELEEAAYSLC
jgi:acyl-CoA hydrolase